MPFPSPGLQWGALVWIPNQNTGEAMGGRERDLIILVLNYRAARWAIPVTDSRDGKRSHLVSCCDWQMVCPLHPPLRSTHHYFLHK